MTGSMTERQFQQQIEQLCLYRGLTYYHTYDSRRSQPGFPDLVIVGSKGILFREIKTETGRISKMQKHWLDILAMAGSDAAVWRPSDLISGRIQDELKALGRVQVQTPLTVVRQKP